MVSAAPPRLPRLGEPSAAFTHLLGLPWQVTIADGGIVRRFDMDGRRVSVFFTNDRAVAVLCPYAPPVKGRSPLLFQPHDLQPAAETSKPRVLVGDSGWVVATADCPWPYIRSLAAVG